MTTHAPHVSIVMRTYTEARWPWFIEAVESVLRQTVTPLEIVVVVDHNPALRERVAAQFPQVRAVENPGAAGSAGAWNACVAAARGSIVVFFDDDAVAEPTWLARLLAHYDDPRVLGVGGAIVGEWLAGRPRWFASEFDWVVGCTYTGLPTSVAPVRNLIGCNMSFRRHVFDGVGGFRSSLGHMGGRPIGCDETELCIRIGQRWPDREIRYDPNALVYHRVPPTRTTRRAFYERCFLEGRSKALVSQLVGSPGILTELRYTLHTLPRGIARGLRDTLRGDVGGVLRAATIVSGLVVTAGGYALGRLQLALRRNGNVGAEAPPLIVPQ